MKPNKVAVFTKLECDSDFAYTKEAVRVLTESGIQVLINQNVKYRLGDQRDSVQLIYSERDLLESADMIAVLGGDGTMLDVCVRASESAKPVVGVNLGNLGFLTAVERDRISDLSALASGDFTIEDRMMLDVEIAAKFTVHRQRVLNEVVIASGTRSKIAEFELSSSAGKLLGYRADGLIVSTPTGSTAYSLSAGGPVAEPTASLISVTPICPHTLLRSSVLFSPEAELTVKGRTKADNTDILITADGKNSTYIPCDSEIKIRRSQYTAKIVKIGSDRFFDILETKLNRK